LSIKDGVEILKEEITKEEKLFEEFVKLERFYKKNKKTIIGIIGVVFIFLLGWGIYEWKIQSDLEASNEAFIRLLSNPEDKNSLEILKNKNSTLFEIYNFLKAKQDKNMTNLKISSKLPVIEDIIQYEQGVEKEDKISLKNYSFKEDALYKDFAIITEAYLLFKDNEIKKAKNELGRIEITSPLYPYAKMLLHYGLKDEK
jgi:predicted negative regulator of RcsB-dependent stress response